MRGLKRRFSRRRRYEDLSVSIQEHLEAKVEELLEEGMPREEAERAARRAFGNVALIEERGREAWQWPRLESVWADVRFALRQLQNSPSFTITALLTLALGIGINTALFSIVNAVLLHPMDVPHPAELVAVDASKPNFENGSISYLNFRDWQKENRCFSALAIFRRTGFLQKGKEKSERVYGDYVSADLFSLLGVKPVLGRLFAPEEDVPGRNPTALISEGLWARSFGSMPQAIGKTLTLDGRAFTVIGVIPANFDLAFSAFGPGDVYVPIGQWQTGALTDRGAGLSIHGVARLSPGMTFARAQANMNAVSESLAAAYPKEDHDIRANLTPLRYRIVGDIQPILLSLLGAVGFVLLIACVNVANLQMARSHARAQEFAVRLSLGATRTRIIRQLLTESLLLSLGGGVLGLLLADWGIPAAVALAPTALPRTSAIRLSPLVLGATLAISLAAGILLGLLPAWKLATQQPQAAMKERGRGTSPARHRSQSALVIFEIAAAFVLLVGAGVMIRSLIALSRSNPGFDAKGVLTFSLSVPSIPDGAADGMQAYLRAVDDRIKSVPGVQASSLSGGAVPMGGDDEQLFWLDNQTKPVDLNDMQWALRYIVEPDYLKTMHIPLLRGRFLTGADREGAPLAAVIDDSFAQRYFGSENPVGKRLNLDGADKQVQIVGVVGHVMQWTLDNDAGFSLRSQIYLPLAQQLGSPRGGPTGFGSDVLVRADDADAVFPGIQAALRQMNSEQVAYRPVTMTQMIETTLAARLFFIKLLGFFAGLALLLAGIGLYGVVSYLVSQRTQEIAIRMALGANRRDVLLHVLGNGTRLALTGIAIGVCVALALTGGLTRISIAGTPVMYRVRFYDPLTQIAVIAVFLGVTLAACYFPACRASAIEPMRALRAE